MTDTTENDRAVIGNNQPPSDIEIIGESVKRVHPESIAKAERLIAEAAERIPEEINDDETAGKVGDFVKQLTAAKKDLEGIRVMEKEPYLVKSRAVDGFFKRFTEKLDQAKEKASEPLGAYKDRKDAEIRRQREEEARRQRYEAEAKLKEAERLRQEAEELRKKQAEERRQKDEAARLERERIEREAAEERKKAQDALDAEKKLREDAEQKLRDAKAQKVKDQEAIEAAEKERDEAKQRQKEAEERTKQVEADRKEQEKALRETEKENEVTAKQVNRDARATERESDKLLHEAIGHDKAGQKMDKAALGVNQRIRGEDGSVTTTSKKWVGTMAQRATLDLEKLREHIPADALDRAVQAYVDAGGRILTGAHIFEDTIVQVR